VRHHGYLAVALAGMTAAAGWILSQTDIVDASEEESSSFREVYSESRDAVHPSPDPKGMRLNYFDARWNRVLEDVAKHTELTLVMDKVPPGRFARRDRTRYSTADCVRILNRELEGLGYRLVKQGEYLIVLNLDQARTRYARPLLTSEETPGSDDAESAGDPFRPASARVDQLNARWASESDSDDDETEAFEQEPRETTTIPISPDVVQDSNSLVEADDTADEAPAALVVRKVEIDHSTAAEVARAVYLVFERRSELLQKGIQDLPTFVVYDTNDTDKSGEPLFRIGIDQQGNRLVVESDEKRAEHLVKLLHRLDKPAAVSADDDASKLVEAPDVTDETARALNDQLRRLVAMRRQEEPADQPVPAATTDAAPEIADSSAFNLRGDVNIQAMQELGVLMIEGNEEDLERLGPIIDRLEQMSVGSLPDIHLLELQHVNSEAFAELLTSVYDRLAELRRRGEEERQTVAFYAVAQPNSVLILAPQLELPAILELAERLDTRLDPGSEFQVFELKNAIASQVVAGLESFYEDRGGLGTRIRPLADVRTNSVIVQGHPRDLVEVERLIDGLDRDKPGAVHKVRIIELSHATANELAEVLNSAIQAVTSPPQTTSSGIGGFGGNQGPQELRDTKSIALEFLSTNGDAQELLRSGFLVDVRINADPRSNTLIVSAPEASMTLLHALIETLDQPPSAIAAIKVFALQNADAEQSVELLTTMFENTNQEEQLGVQIAGAEDAASSLIPLQFSADIRTNTVLAVGSEEALSIVEAILLRLDTDDARQRTTTVIELRNSRAEDVAESINIFLEQQQALRDSSDDLVSNVERIREEAIVAPDFSSNSLIVSASPEYFSRITEIIGNLDSSKPQVVIQALIVEVGLDNTDEFGVELGFQDPLLFQRSIVESIDDLITIPTTVSTPSGLVSSTTIVSQSNTPGLNFNNTAAPLGNNLAANSSPVASQGISNFSLGRQNGDLGYGGFVFSAQSDAVNVLIRALAARRSLHVLSRPQIRATHNNTATIRVGQEVSVVNGVQIVQTGIVSPTVEQRNTGIILTVTPRITPDGTVVMAVFAEKSRVNPTGVPLFTDVNTGEVIESAIIDVALAETTVDVPNGQTIVIGGMITKSDETLERKVPWLGDLPVVGKAFRYDSTNTVRTELLIFLTPRIVYSDADAELIKQVETERLHFLESEAEEIHGPLYSVPARREPMLEGIVPGPESIVPEMPFSDPNFQSELQDGAIGPNDSASETLPEQVRRSSRSSTVRTVSTQDADTNRTVRQARHETARAAREPSWIDRVFKRKPARRQRDSKGIEPSAADDSAENTDPDLSELGFGDVDWN